jgi:hypothetical protein
MLVIEVNDSRLRTSMTMLHSPAGDRYRGSVRMQCRFDDDVSDSCEIRRIDGEAANGSLKPQ